MKPEKICAICGIALTAMVVAEELNPRLVYQIPEHTHQEGHMVIINTASPFALSGGATVTHVIGKEMTYVVKSPGL